MFKSITIKIGSNVLTNTDGTLHQERVSHLVDQIASLHKKNKKIILVSSGAVAAGRTMVKLNKKTDTVSSRQLLSSVGQVKLLNTYSALFEKHGIQCAQVLVTKQDFRSREHYLNMKNCLSTLIENGIVPIINENDAVSVTALMFTDNDELAGLLSSMMNSEALIILSNVNGIYDGDPKDKGAKVIRTVDSTNADLSAFISTTKSNFGRGGMLTKCHIAQKTAISGTSVHIANGTIPNILVDLNNSADTVEHTRFLPGEKYPAIKKWIAYSESFTNAEVIINKGAFEALNSSKATSLLLAGVIKINGNFKKGDLIKIISEDGKDVGIGKAQYDKTKAIEHLSDSKYQALIHYDYLYIR
ncbi:glutamate 5-kinase [Plebeiibacterium marinum]|uniref:Glutamate 5-kinase n=1 Tax=Plebeiibacterium marinum TaxID=2992111 RepID=A0AAE3SIE1_9BACT|nr:glutamate 5-kinase [Plebeiobacterium marinum]MCW3804353.1 glutamate 5-kinase [Plebeiobacterium marinum]